jgi:large subunit ribosomal protein L9
VTIPSPIKSLGTHTATVALAPEVSATVTLEVVAG